MIIVAFLLAIASAFAGAVLRAFFLALPLMIGLHFLHWYIPLAPQLGFVACFWLLFVVALLFPVGAKGVVTTK